jgi:hypothetical protein
MPYSVVDKGSKYFTAKTYTGTGANLTISGLEFAPDFVWFKGRSALSDHGLFDKVRGVQLYLRSNLTNAEGTSATSLTAFNSDGYNLGSSDLVNGSGYTTVSWNWLAGGTGVSNTAGTISSTVSANTTSGFSIVSYTGNGTAGATIGHGLGAVPKMMIVKPRSAADHWAVYHASLPSGASNIIYLNLTNAYGTSAGFWNNTTPTSSVFSVGSGDTNVSSRTYIAYCFADVKGFSKFGSYTGNGSADGTFVYTGFKPKFFLAKRTDTTNSWTITNSNNITYNQIDNFLLADSSQAESSATSVDYLSNGVKIRSTGAWGNASGGTYIYMAFADSPIVSSKGIPTTAR